MTDHLFQSHRDDGKAYWRIVFEKFESVDPGDIVSHQEIYDLIGTTNKSLLYNSVSRAAKELRQKSHRDLLSIRGKGYRVLHANEHVSKATVHKDRAVHQLVTANEVVDATDLAALTSSERDLWSQVKRGMVLLYQAVSSHQAELSRHEALIASLQQRMDDIEQR